MKQKNYQRWSRPLLLTLLSVFMAFSGASSAWADAYTCGFEASEGWSAAYANWKYTTTPGDGWSSIGTLTDYNVASTYKYQGDLGLGNTNYNNTTLYIVSPKLAAGTVSFYAKRLEATYGIYIYKATYNELTSSFETTGTYIDRWYKSGNTLNTTYSQISFTLDEDSYVAIRLAAAAIDDFSAANGLANAGAIPAPTAFTKTASTYNSATFSWTAGGEENAWQIVYGATGFNKDEASPVDVTTNPYTLSGLSESTTYDAYLRAKSGEDVSSWTSKVTFTTPVQFPVPTNFAASGETTEAATLSWTAGSTETTWEIRYSTELDFDPTAEEGTLVSVTTTPSKELTGLAANTTYYAAVRAKYGESDYSAWTDKINFKTLQVATDASNYSDDFETSNNWNLINGTQTNAWAWGTAAKKDGSKGLYISNDGGTTNAYSGSSTVYASQLFSFAAGDYIVSYDWLCKGEKSGYGTTAYDYLRVFLVPAATELTAGSSSFSYSGQPTGWISLDDAAALVNVNEWQHKSVNISIPSNTNYNVVFAWTSDGSGGDNPPAAIDNFSIRLNDTPNPTSLAVTDITAHAGTLGWTSTDNTWEVYHSTSSTTPAVDQTPTASPNTNSYTFTGLDAETKYYVWVRSVSKTNASWKSDWVGTNFTTDIAAVAPTGLTASSITATGATLSWTAGADETKWDLVYGTVNDAESLSNTKEEINTTPTKVLTGLTSETTYYAFVRAKKGEEVSSWVNISFFPTATVQLTVNDGDDTSSGVPVYGYFADNAVGHSQFIIPATGLTAIDGGVIKKLAFYANQTSISWTGTFKVYMKEVAETEFASNAFMEWATLTEVYSGSLSVADNKMQITLDTPFEYNGGNLLIGFNETISGNYVASTWLGTNTSENTAIIQTGSYSPQGPDYSQFLPKTTFTYLPVTGAKMQINKTAIDFGSVTSLPQNETFTISNSKGVADLTNIVVAITGTNAAAYSVSALPRTTITTTGETAADIELTVTFNPAAGGTYNDATITINADDQEEKTIALTGTYVANPVMGVFNDSEATDAATTGETINFGYAEEAPVYTYYIKNTGAGTLDIAVTAGGLTVSPANASLAAGAQQAFTITTLANTDATVTFTGTNHDGGAAIGTFTVTLQGTVMSETGKFFEGFNHTNGTATTSELVGWEINNTDTPEISFYNSYLYYWASGDETANVVTPKLRVSGTSDVLRISAYLRNKSYNNTLLSISYSADKTNWTEVLNKGKNDLELDAQDFTIDGIPEGSYYFKIEMSDVAVGYFYGFSTTLPDAIAVSESVDNNAITTGVLDVNVTYTKAAEKWGTIALPFETTTTELGTVYGTTVNAYNMKSYDEGTGELVFQNVTTLEAGKPYIIYSPEEMNGAKTFYNKNITETTAGSETLGTTNTVTFQATYAPMAAGTMNGKWGVTPAGKVMMGNESATMNALRGYLTTSVGARLGIVIDNEATGIKTLLRADDFEKGDIYNLKGQKVEKAHKGLYIVNGRKVVVK